MKLQVGIEYPKGGKKGLVIYDTDKKIIDVEFDHKKKKDVEKYLSRKREYKIPESQEIDDYRVDKAYPKDNRTYFELAICELFTHTEVWVDWGREKEIK